MQIGNNKFELKEYLTAKDNRTINSAMMSKVKLNAEGRPETISYDAVEARENALIEAVVLSVNDVKENILETVLNLPITEYNQLLEVLQSKTGVVSEKKAD